MNPNRRVALKGLLVGMLAGVALVLVRRGVPGGSGLFKGLASATGRPVPTKEYGYREINLS